MRVATGTLLLATIATGMHSVGPPLLRHTARPVVARCRRLGAQEGGSTEGPADASDVPAADPPAAAMPGPPAAAAPEPVAAAAAAPQTAEDAAFEARLQAISERYENAVPISPEERKKQDEIEIAARAAADKETRWWTKEFFALCYEDLRSVEWPSQKKIVQTLFISQLAFVGIVVLVLVADALFNSTIRTLLLGEPFRFGIEQILKMTPADTV